MQLSRNVSMMLMGASAVMALAMLGLVSKLTRPSSRELAQQKLWAWNMGYEHHEQPPFQTFPVRSADGPLRTVAGKGKMQQLWGFNLGYEHHEQKPIYFGVRGVPQAAARQMQLWGWNMGSEHHEQMPIPFGAKNAKTNSLSSPQAQAPVQQLWGFNLGYEHHEQKPIAFGAVNSNAARQMQLFRVDDMDSEAEANMDPANGRGSDLHVLSDDGVWIKPEFKKYDDNYALHSLVGAGNAR